MEKNFLNELVLNKRYFTEILDELNNEEKRDVYSLFKWKNVDVELWNYNTNEVMYSMKNLEFPEFYSENACNIIASKYFNKAFKENSLKQVVHRMVTFWIDSLEDEGIIETDTQKEILYDELVYTLLNQMWAPNSPQWFNTGIERTYGGNKRNSECYSYSTEEAKSIPTDKDFNKTQASACFILSIEDSLIGKNSITDHYKSETKLFKGGSGVGTNYSTLRAKGESLSKGGESSGAMSFIKGLDVNAGTIKAGGVSRRAARMNLMDEDHPEIFDFINWKANEEKKVKDLIKMDYDPSMNGEAYSSVSGQNSNNSVRLSNYFMNQIYSENYDATIELKGRVDDKVNRKIKVWDLWEEINKAAWECGDPGIQFKDHFEDWNTCKYDYNGNEVKINSTNPCSEYAFLDNTACNLASINLIKFLDHKSYLDYNSFTKLVFLIQLVLEASIHWGEFPTEEIATNTHFYRTTGLGFSNLASFLLENEVPYDSTEGNILASMISSLMTGSSYLISAAMAEKVGSFPAYNYNKNTTTLVLSSHFSEYKELMDDNDLDNKNTKFGYFSDSIYDIWEETLALNRLYGVRNAQVTVIAPTGTIAFAMDCASTSAEPFYSHKIYKKMVDGTSLELINPYLENYIKSLKLNNEEEVLKNIFDMDFLKQNLTDYELKIIETVSELSPESHVRMVASITPHISGGISKTINLPNTATVEDVKRINLYAYKMGCKCITVYRDGCKASQPLNSIKDDDNKKDKELNDYTYNELLDKVSKLMKDKELNKSNSPNKLVRNKLEGIRQSTTHPSKIDNLELYTTVGYYDDGRIGEIFVSTDKDGNVVKGLLASMSKLISHMLQYGIKPEDISVILRNQKYEPSGFVERHPYIKTASSISDLISKIIDFECGNYDRCQVKPEELNKKTILKSIIHKENDNLKIDQSINNNKVYDKICPNCGSSNMKQNGTCYVCSDCGSTTGCS